MHPFDCGSITFIICAMNIVN